MSTAAIAAPIIITLGDIKTIPYITTTSATFTIDNRANIVKNITGRTTNTGYWCCLYW